MEIASQGFLGPADTAISESSGENKSKSGMSDIWKLPPISQFFCSGDLAFMIAFRERSVAFRNCSVA